MSGNRHQIFLLWFNTFSSCQNKSIICKIANNRLELLTYSNLSSCLFSPINKYKQNTVWLLIPAFNAYFKTVLFFNAKLCNSKSIFMCTVNADLNHEHWFTIMPFRDSLCFKLNLLDMTKEHHMYVLVALFSWWF